MQKFAPCPTDGDILRRMKEAVQDAEVRARVHTDYITTFRQIGVASDLADQMSARILGILDEDSVTRDDFERRKHAILENMRTEDGRSFLDAMRESMQGRAQLIFKQISPYIGTFARRKLDFGAGDAQVAHLVQTMLGGVVDAIDVSPFTHPDSEVQVDPYDGNRIPREQEGYYHTTYATNVFHHAADNQKCLEEISRVTSDTLVIIETVPIGNDSAEIEQDRWRTFMNDVMWNIILKNPGTRIPVPGTYETPQGWIERIEALGWKLVHQKNLGVDQKTIQDTHHLLVFRRVKKDTPQE